MRYIAASKSLAVVIGAFVQQVRVKPDNRTGRNFRGNAVLVAGIAGQFEFCLLRPLNIVVFGNGLFVTAGNHV